MTQTVTKSYIFVETITIREETPIGRFLAIMIIKRTSTGRSGSYDLKIQMPKPAKTHYVHEASGPAHGLPNTDDGIIQMMKQNLAVAIERVTREQT